MATLERCAEPGCEILTRLGRCNAHRIARRALFEAVIAASPFLRAELEARVRRGSAAEPDAVSIELRPRAMTPVRADGHSPMCEQHGCRAMGCAVFLAAAGDESKE